MYRNKISFTNKCNLTKDIPKIHPNILDTLFKYKETIYLKFTDLKGIFLLDHISINIIDPSNTIAIFSITPSVEYNLIIQNIWEHDQSFFPHAYQDEDFFLWEHGYAKNYFHNLKKIKQERHGLYLGFNIIRKIQNYTFIYSFATRHNNIELSNFYQSQKYELLKMGDYAYNLIKDIYRKHCISTEELPNMINKTQPKKRTYLKLITGFNK